MSVNRSHSGRAYCCKSATMPRTLYGRLAPASCQWRQSFLGSGNRAGGIENAADVTVRQGLALRPLFEFPGGEREMHQHGDVMRTIVAVALKADFADGVFIGQVFFQHLPFLQKAETVQLCGDLCAGMEEGFVEGHRWRL